jgi:hypothetical protein
MDIATPMLRVQPLLEEKALFLHPVRRSDGKIFFRKMRRVSNHVLVTERDQVVDVVVFFKKLLRVHLQVMVEEKKVG